MMETGTLEKKIAKLPESLKLKVDQFVFDNDIRIITVEISHTNTLLKLEHYHGDPFDRLLIA